MFRLRLMMQLRDQEANHSQLIQASKHATQQLEGLIPDSKQSNGMHDFVMKIFGKYSNKKCITVDANENPLKYSTETMEQLVNDIGHVRTHLNNTELQLYEANEKIAELIENVSFSWIIYPQML